MKLKLNWRFKLKLKRNPVIISSVFMVLAVAVLTNHFFGKDISEIIKKDKEGYESLVKKGEEADANKDLSGAIKYYQEALKVNPNKTELKSSLANAYFRNQQTDEAMKIWQEQVKTDPENIYTLNYIANGYRDKGDTENAIKYYKEAIEKGNTDSVANLVTLYNNSERFDESIALLNDQLAKAPESQDFLRLLGSTYIKKGETAKGNKILEGLK